MGCNNSKTKGAKKGKKGEEPPAQQGSVQEDVAARNATTSQPGDVPGTPVPPPIAAESTTTYGTPYDGTSERRAASAEAASAGRREAEAAAAKAAAADPEETHAADAEARHNADGATSTASSANGGSESDAGGAHGESDAVEALVQSPNHMSSTARGEQQAEAVAPGPSSDAAAGPTTDDFTPVATDDVTGVPASRSTRHAMTSPPPQEPLTTGAAVPAEETSQGSDVHFEVLDTDEDAAVVDHEEWPAVGEEEEEEEEVQPHAQRLTGSDAAVRRSPPPNLTDPDAITPMAMEEAPVPTPVRSAAGGKARGSAAPSSNGSFHGPKQQQQQQQHPVGSGPRRPTSRKPSVAGSSVSAAAYASSRRSSWKPTRKQQQQLQQRPPWQSIVPELDEDEDYAYEHTPAAAAAARPPPPPPPRPASQRSATSEEYYRVMAPAHPAAAAAPASPSASSTELAMHEAELPASTPPERIAARRRRAGMGHTAMADPPAMELAVHPRSSSRGASTNASHPRQRRASAQLAVLPPIPYRQGYTDPSPGAAPYAHRPTTTYMPPPTAFAMRSAADGSASARPVLDPKVFVAAIEASTTGLVQAHHPRMHAAPAAAPSQHSAARPTPASLAPRLPVAGADASVYREPVKLAPSHLCDPVYADDAAVVGVTGSATAAAAAAPATNGAVSASASTYSRSSQQARAQAGSVPAPPPPPPLAGYASPASFSQPSQRSAPASRAAAAPASTAASSYKTAASVTEARPRAAVRQRAPAPSAGYGDDVDAASVDALSYRTAQEVGDGYEQVYSSAQEPRERSAVTYEPSITDEAPPTAASVLQANSTSRNGTATANAAARANANAAVDEGAYDGYAEEEEGEPEQRHPREPSWSAAEGEEEYDAYGADASESSHKRGGSVPPVEDGAAASVKGQAESESATATALTAMPSSDGHVVEHKDPEWQLLQPPPAENRRLLNQAKFVAQMRNVTPI